MARLIARTDMEGLPRNIDGMRLDAVVRDRETLIAPFKGKEGAVSEVLGALGLRMPVPNEVRENGDAAIVWAGRGKALLIGAEAPQGVAEHAAVIDQTGAQAVVLVSGDGIEEVLARLVPIDLRPAAFPVGTVAQTMLGHMTAQVRRTVQGIEVAVMRSMAGTLVHDLSVAARHHAARRDLPA